MSETARYKRRELIDLLATVPRLRERAGRDAWLSKNLDYSMQDQIRRHGNCSNDLTFIISSAEYLQLSDGRCVLLVLLEDLIEELGETRLADKVKEIREKFEAMLEGRAEESPVGPGKQPAGPSGNPKRQEWLKRLEFRRDPFRYTDGGADPFLQEYFYVGMRHFHDVFDVSRTATVFVLGPPGSGKSSLRNVIEQLGCRDNIFSVVYRDFGPLVRRHNIGEEVQVEDHVIQILKTALRTLVDLSGEDVSLTDTEENKTIRNHLWLYVTHYEKDPRRKLSLATLLKPDQAFEGALPDDPRELLGRFCRYVTELLGYQFVYILIDPEEEIP